MRTLALLRFLGIAALTVASASGSSHAQIPPVTVFYSDGLAATPVQLGSISLHGRDPFTLLPDSGTSLGSLGMAVDPANGHLYFCQNGPGSRYAVERINLNGTGLTTVLEFDAAVDGVLPIGVSLDLVNGRVYWAAQSGNFRIGSCKLDGTDARFDVAANDAFPPVLPQSIDVDAVGGKIYWHDPEGFRSANLDGSGIVTVLDLTTVAETAWAVDVVNGHFYYTMVRDLYRAPIDGSSAPAVVLTDPDVFAGGNVKITFSHKTDTLIWQPSGNRLHWTSLSNPGVIEESTALSGIAGIYTLQAMPGPEVVLSVTPEPVPTNGPAQFQVSGATPSSFAFVYVTQFDGSPFVQLVLTNLPLDAEGRYVQSFPVPPTLSGHTAQFVAIALDPSQFVVVSCPEDVTFQ